MVGTQMFHWGIGRFDRMTSCSSELVGLLGARRRSPFSRGDVIGHENGYLPTLSLSGVNRRKSQRRAMVNSQLWRFNAFIFPRS
jgi:hypothetical protein